MSRTLILGLLSALVAGAGACGGIARIDDGAGGDAATGTSGPSTTNATKASTTGTKASSAAQKSAAGNTTGGPADITAFITDVAFGANCQPGDANPDPLAGSIDVRYDNTGVSPGAVEIIDASIVYPIAGGDGRVFSILLEPTSSGQVNPGSPVVVTHKKVAAVGDHSDVCNFCNDTGSFSLVFDNGKQVEQPFGFGCAF